MTPRRATRYLYQIATEISKDWSPNVSYAAERYLYEMSLLNEMDEMHGDESAEIIVRNFLINSGAWRGETARRIKAELQEMLDHYNER